MLDLSVWKSIAVVFVTTVTIEMIHNGNSSGPIVNPAADSRPGQTLADTQHRVGDM